MTVFQEQELLQACRVLFGPEVALSRDFLYYIRPEGVKSAFRRQALLTHPDTRPELVHEERTHTDFVEVVQAYRDLAAFMDRKETAVLDAGLRSRSCPPKDTSGRQFYRGALPRRRLLFAEFLYYSGAISWLSMIQAVVWQRRMRPRFGEIACRWRYLSDAQMRTILSGKKFYEKTGDAAVRMKLLQMFQVQIILRHQMISQRRIGEFFMEQEILTGDQIKALLRSFESHNSLFSSRS